MSGFLGIRDSIGLSRAALAPKRSPLKGLTRHSGTVLTHASGSSGIPDRVERIDPLLGDMLRLAVPVNSLFHRLIWAEINHLAVAVRARPLRNASLATVSRYLLHP